MAICIRLLSMTIQTRYDYLTREDVLKLLSDDEVASVSTAETAPRLADGDEYLDLEQLQKGVQRAAGRTAPLGRLLPKKAVRAATWAAILHRLPPPRPYSS
jgi:hypothetical protein